jgi:BASS family bile acid:Na+ symporter
MSIVAQVSFAALALSVLVLAILRARVLLTSEGLAIIGLMSLLALGAMWIGHALGGPELDTRRTLAVTGAARNQGLSLLLAKVNFPNLDVLPTILGYLIACAIAYAIYARSTRDTPQAKHSARPGSHAHAHTR